MREGFAAVQSPAGPFHAEALRVGDTRIFRSGRVPLWGLVRAVSQAGQVELLRFGDGGLETVFPPGWD
jgi:hypothetical protein